MYRRPYKKTSSYGRKRPFKKYSFKRKRSYSKKRPPINRPLPTICKQKHKLELEFNLKQFNQTTYPSKDPIVLQLCGNDINAPMRTAVWPISYTASKKCNGVDAFYQLYTHGYCNAFKIRVILKNVSNSTQNPTDVFILGMHPLRQGTPLPLATDAQRRVYKENNFYINSAVNEDNEQGTYQIGTKQYLSVKKFFMRQVRAESAIQENGVPLSATDSLFYAMVIQPFDQQLNAFTTATKPDTMDWNIKIKLTQYITWNRAFKIRTPVV